VDELEELRGALEIVAGFYRSPAFLDLELGTERLYRPQLSATAVRAASQSLYLQQLIGRPPKNYMLAAAQLRHGDVEAAMTTLERIAAKMPGRPTPHVDLAELYLELGRSEDARRALETARALAPDAPRVVEAWRRNPLQ
jgi:Flp pilus assembly protein TadD